MKQYKYVIIKICFRALVANAYNLATWEAEVRRIVVSNSF
jgi:hypothetical protein